MLLKVFILMLIPYKEPGAALQLPAFLDGRKLH